MQHTNKASRSGSNIDLILTEDERQLALDRIYQAPNPQAEAADPSLVDVRTVAPRHRHPLIFDTFEGLTVGQSFTLVNDHDPKPLYYQFQAERSGQFTWEYLEQGPTVWRVRIGRSLS